VFRTLFDYLRHGQSTKAWDLCRKIQQPWRAAALRGALVFRDPSIGTAPSTRNRHAVSNAVAKNSASLVSSPWAR